MILLVQHITKMSLCCEVISSFVTFAVLDLRVSGCRLRRRCKLLSFYNNNNCCFSWFRIYLSNFIQTRPLTANDDVILIFQDGGHRVGNYFGFGFGESTRSAMYKSICTLNLNKIAQSTTELLLLLIWENGRPPYWNYTSVFNLTYSSSWVYRILHWHTKFEFSSFNRSRDVEGVPKFQK